MYGTRFGLSLLVALVAASMALPPSAQAEPLKCKAGILKSSAAFVQAKAKALQKCEDGRVKGKITGDCPDTKALDTITKAQGKLADSIAKACGGKDKLCGNAALDPTEDALDTIGWDIGTCPNFDNGACNNDIPNCGGISLCVGCIGGSAVNEAIDLYYGSLNPTDPKAQKALNKCQQAIGKAATSFLLAQSKALQKCWDGKNKGKINDCPDIKTSDKITNAGLKAKSTIGKACGGKDKVFGGSGENIDLTPTEIGFPANCRDVHFPGPIVSCDGTVSTLENLADCVLCSTRFDGGCADRGAAIPFTTYPEDCNPGPVATPTPTTTATPTPTATQTPSALCGNGVLNQGEICDPNAASPDNQCPNVNNTDFPCNQNCTCACPATVTFAADASDQLSVLDAGWTGIAHKSGTISDGLITATVSDCAGSGRPCGQCTLGGPVENAGTNVLKSRRCTNNSSVRCSSNTPCFKQCVGGSNDGAACTAASQCTGGGSCPAAGTCQFFFGSTLPLSSGGVATCTANEVAGPLTGTANIETGESASVMNLTAHVFTGITTDQPCPQCNGDTTRNDGVTGGTCSGGDRNGLACDVNGESPNVSFGKTSLDCPPTAGANVANLAIRLGNSTGQEKKTLSEASPNCRAFGYTTLKCLCDTCNNASAEPCAGNADCPVSGGNPGICGGKRCQSGTNAGAPCTTGSQCPSGSCTIPGTPTAPNACLPPDGAAPDGCQPAGGNRGLCVDGPSDNNCAAPEQHRGCTSSNFTECPVTGTCVTKNRECFLDEGVIGNSLVADGAADPPVNDQSTPTIASVFCIGPTGAAAVNNVAGLPGPARLTLRGLATGHP